MRRLTAICVSLAGMMAAVLATPVGTSAGVLDHLWNKDEPPSLTQVARMIDGIQEDILDKGTVVVKQPDIWSQARMTMFRKEYEDTMRPEVAKFQDYLSARIARSDFAQLTSDTALGASLTPVDPKTPIRADSAKAVLDERTAAFATVTTTTKTDGSAPAPPAATTPATTQNFTLLQSTAPVGEVEGTDGKLGVHDLKLGLEPNIHIKEKEDYIHQLQRRRQVNLGDDNSDSAGYGLYLMRVPVSIQPGDKTVRGHGAIVNMTMSHDFGPKFLPSTYRNLVIYDLVDLLSPVVQELIRSGDAANYHNAVQDYLKLTGRGGDRDAGLDPQGSREARAKALAKYVDIEKNLELAGNFVVSRNGGRSFAIAPSDVKRIFVPQNLLNLAYSTQSALDLAKSGAPKTWKVRGNDVRAYLRQELEAAYDIMEGRCEGEVPILMDVPYIEDLANQVYCRKFEGPSGVSIDSPQEPPAFYDLYEAFAHRFPGNARYRPIGVLAWGIAIEAGLLNRQLREDMKGVRGDDGYTCPGDVDQMAFYAPTPLPEVELAFQEYVKARWPMITFSLEPDVDQQNIDDAFTRRTDLQLAVAFALSSGRLSFRQATKFNRQLQYEAQTLALNQTVSSFAHGNDTFGWRFTPRFQTPPEMSNIRAIPNLLIRGGPGPDYGLKHSKIEPGLRELTAVVVMPSFVRSMKLEVAGDWFHLHDPDDRKFSSARAVALGRRINEARSALDAACKCGLYRPEDTDRLRAKLHQLERMLPLQTQHVNVPYENTLGGFALFTQGATALVPELAGYEGVEYLDTEKGADVVVYGKHFSIYETAVVVGGKSLPREGTGTATVKDAKGNTVVTGTTISPLVTTKNQLVVLDGDGHTIPDIPDGGTYDIMSREVLRIRIPPHVAVSHREDGQVVVELYVATPNGISNRLQIPVLGADKISPAGAGTGTDTSKASFFFANPGLTITLDVTRDKDDKILTEVVSGDVAGQKVELKVSDAPTKLPTTVDVEMVFPVDSTNIDSVVLRPIKASFTLMDGVYTLTGKPLLDLATTLHDLMSHNKVVIAPPKGFTSLPATVSAGDSKPTTTVNGLGVRFKFELVAPAPAPPAPAPVASRPAGAAPSALEPTPALSSTATPPRSAVADHRPARAPADPSVWRTAALLQDTPAAPIPPDSQVTLPQTLAALRALATQPAAAPPLPPPAPQTIVVMPPRAPSVAVSVPITNVPAPKHPLLRRRNPPPVRGPLLERLRGNP